MIYNLKIPIDLLVQLEVVNSNTQKQIEHNNHKELLNVDTDLI